MGSLPRSSGGTDTAIVWTLWSAVGRGRNDAVEMRVTSASSYAVPRGSLWCTRI